MHFSHGAPPGRRSVLRFVGALVLVGGSLWFVSVGPVHRGPTLVSFTDTHGIDLSDLVVLPLLALAAWLVWPRRRARVAPAAAGPTRPPSAPPVKVLVVCSANRCRSPIAAALLQQRLDAIGVAAVVRSAGTNVDPGAPVVDEALALVPGLAEHRSTPLRASIIGQADLVLGVTRHHVRESVLLDPDALRRTFTVLELARRGRVAGARGPGRSLAVWLEELAAGRQLTDLAGSSAEDDLADPTGEGAEAFRALRTALDGALDEITRLAWGPRGAGP